MNKAPLSMVTKVEDGWWRLTTTEKTRYLFVRDGIFYDMEAFLTKNARPGDQWAWSLKEIKGLLPDATLEAMTQATTPNQIHNFNKRWIDDRLKEEIDELDLDELARRYSLIANDTKIVVVESHLDSEKSAIFLNGIKQ